RIVSIMRRDTGLLQYLLNRLKRVYHTSFIGWFIPVGLQFAEVRVSPMRICPRLIELTGRNRPAKRAHLKDNSRLAGNRFEQTPLAMLKNVSVFKQAGGSIFEKDRTFPSPITFQRSG